MDTAKTEKPFTTEVTGDTVAVTDLNALTGQIIDSAMRVLLESAYKACLSYELSAKGLMVEIEVPLPIVYGGIKLNAGYRIDLLVSNSIIVEVKCLDKILPIHRAQLLSYLRLSGKKYGLLLNFNVPRMKYGITRMAN